MRPPYPVIDAHTHIMPWQQVRSEDVARLARGWHDADRVRAVTSDPQRLIAYLDERGIEKIVMINFVSHEVFGLTETVNDFAATMARHAPDRLIPFGGIDPRRVPDVAAEMDRLLGELGIRGIKLHPPHQHFRVNAYLDDPALRGLATVYEKCIAYGAPLMVHTGTSVFPGARNKYGDPMDLDDVLVDFPELKLILAHGGRPLWMDTAWFLLRRWPQLMLDISSIPPQRLLTYFPWLETVADRALFGSDWPGPGVIDPLQNIEDVYALPISEAAKRNILHDTAARLFGDG